MRMRLLWALLLVQSSCAGWAADADTASYPNRPIRLIIGFPAGTTDDYMARTVAPKLSERLGQPAVVDNRAGAAGNLAAELAAHANPDGYTLLLVGSLTMASSVTLYPKLAYNPLKDFSYIAVIASGPNVLMAHPSVPVKTFPDLVALIRAKPKSLSYGSAGLASTGHLAMALLLSRIKTDLLHVPYKGGSAAAVALAGGEVQIGFTSIPSGIPLINSKRVIPLAVTSPKRTTALPDIPTVAESGFPGYDVKNTFGFVAPAGTPEAVIKRLNTELQAVVAMDDVREKLASQGVDAGSGTSAAFRALMEAEVKDWARVIKAANIKIE
jgi:tripartite-type tricarboxylate transporter receptor subunit TctC